MSEQTLENITKYLESLNLKETADILRKEQGIFIIFPKKKKNYQKVQKKYSKMRLIT